MATITQVISDIPVAGHRGVDVRDTFVSKQEAFQDHLVLTTVDELNEYKNQTNAVATEINTNLTTIYEPITDNIVNVNLVGNNITSVNTVAGSIANVNIVAPDIASTNTVAGSITNVNLVGNNLTNVNTVATNITNVNNVGNNITSVATVATDISKVTITANNITKVGIVSDNISSVNTVSTNIANVNTVVANLTNVNNVGNNIAKVNTVSDNIVDVTTIADNMTEVTYFADIYQGTKTVAPTLRNDGSSLQIGDLYFHNDLVAPLQSSMRVYGVGGWAVTAINTNLLYTKTQLDTVNILRADKYLAAQDVANMEYVGGNLTKVQYRNATDVDYQLLAYVDGTLSTVVHYVGGVLKGTTTLSYTDGSLTSANFIGV